MVMGPRQSGKMTLCRTVLSDRPYVSLRRLDVRTEAELDPEGFVREYRDGAVIHDAQLAPVLIAYLQELVDEDPAPGRFVLTGSMHFGLSPVINAWMARRVGVLQLLPPGFDELARFGRPSPSMLDALWTGAYPTIHQGDISPRVWLRDYLATYLDHDILSLRNIANLGAFSEFVRLVAGRTAREVNLSALAADVGIRHNTVRAWIHVLESSFLVFRVPAYRPNVRTRQIKAPKLHFLDSGLACHPLGIRTPEELRHHPLRGQIFESWVAAEVLKAIAHRGEEPRLRHYRAAGTEVNLVVDRGERVILAEAKSGATVVPRFLLGMRTLGKALGRTGLSVDRRLIFGGDSSHRRGDVDVLPWNRVLTRTWN
ncbi:MAG: DUF4143 domain-containing protein [Gemmatimonadetes bacterium]|nr:DUF4143 domain-containing protein [Candidatus Palauibacter australiensis]